MIKLRIHLPKSPFFRFVTLFLSVVLFLTVIFLALPMSLPTIPYSLIVQDTKGREIGEIIYEKKIRHRATVLSQVPQFFQDALIALEDHNFYAHL